MLDDAVSTDREFINAFEACTLPADQFHHRDHVRLAWLYLREEALPSALQRYATNLKRYATSLGAAGLYHETITYAFLFLINERIARSRDSSWPEFQQRHPDLFSWHPSILDSYYRPGTLGSELARSTFILPDLALMRSEDPAQMALHSEG